MEINLTKFDLAVLARVNGRFYSGARADLRWGAAGAGTDRSSYPKAGLWSRSGTEVISEEE
jgi:hypothetical protein